MARRSATWLTTVTSGDGRRLPGSGPPVVRQTTPGKLPPFIVSLLPEGWLEEVLKDKDERALLRSGKRYMSNITIVERAERAGGAAARCPADAPGPICEERPLHRHLCRTGPRATSRRASSGISREIYERADTPRLSGIQIKAPMYLDADGTLATSTGKPFTHILKPAGDERVRGAPGRRVDGPGARPRRRIRGAGGRARRHAGRHAARPPRRALRHPREPGRQAADRAGGFHLRPRSSDAGEIQRHHGARRQGRPAALDRAGRGCPASWSGARCSPG